VSPFPLVRAAAVCHASLAAVALAQLSIVEQVVLTGTVESVAGNRVTIRDDDGRRHEVRVQKPGDQGVPLADGRLLAFPADIEIGGAVPAAKLKPGQIVRFRARMNGKGTVAGEVAALEVVDAGVVTVGVAWDDGAPTPRDAADCTVTAPVTKALRGRLVVELPEGAPFRKKTLVACRLADDVRATLASSDLKRIEPGATVVRLAAARLDSGDLVARTLVVENQGTTAVAERGDDALANRHRGLSAEPAREPRLVRSPHFAFLTDISDREWAIVRDKLERMVGLLERYFGRTSQGVVEGFIVHDLAVWPAGTLPEPTGVEKIRRREGICFTTSLGPQRRAELYSCADHGVIQHECVHGFCHLTFGSTGPTWLAEGVAELGTAWRDGDVSVEIDPGVMGYLRNAEPKRTLAEIAVPGRAPAGTWQDYAWRWALCHLLAYNPNYSDRFKPLAVALMEERPGASFDAVYGPVAQQVAFEYDRFLETVGNGYRADLAAWPWKATFRPLAAGGTARTAVKAAAGWQASGVAVEYGATYAVEAEGTWRTSRAGEAGDADGDGAGRGRLVATVFHDFALTEPVPLGTRTTVVATATGQLFLRCDDDWTQLADNDGQISVVIRRP
jgi:hypothetical protein